jgi:O-antigen biosynthesis protein
LKRAGGLGRRIDTAISPALVLDVTQGAAGKAYPMPEDMSVDNLDPNTSYAKILELIGPAKRVIDLGCAGGHLARLLVKHGCEVVGVDSNANALREAKQYCARTILADLDRQPLEEIVGDERFDAAIYADVLEHLRDPWSVLDDTRRVLRSGGYVIASIPNIAHGAIRIGLLTGRFNYNEFGILDDTHLRFFTRRSVGELFVRSGFSIEQIERTALRLFDDSNLVPPVTSADVDEATMNRIRQDEDCETLQFVVKAVALSDEAKLAQLSKEYAKTRSELDDLRERLRSLEQGPAQRIVELEAQLLQNEQQFQQLKEEAAGIERQLREAAQHEAETELVVGAAAVSLEASIKQLRVQKALTARELAMTRAGYEDLLTRWSALRALTAELPELRREVAVLRESRAMLATRVSDLATLLQVTKESPTTVRSPWRARVARLLAALRGADGS